MLGGGEQRAGAGHDDVAAIAVEAGRDAALGGLEAGEAVAHPPQPARGQRVAVDTHDRVAASAPAHRGEVADGAAGAHEDLVRPESRHAGAHELRTHVQAQRLDLLVRGRVRGEEAVGQPQRAEAKAPRPGDRAVLETRDLQAATAEVDDQSALDGQPVDRTQGRAFALGRPIEQIQLDAPAVLDRGREVGRVAGVAQRRGADRADARGAPAPGERHEVIEDRQRAPDRLRRETARGVDGAGEPHGRSRLRDDLEIAVVARTRDHHPQRVRADIDHGDRLRLAGGGVRTRWACVHAPIRTRATRRAEELSGSHDTGQAVCGKQQREGCAEIASARRLTTRPPLDSERQRRTSWDRIMKGVFP